MSEFDGEYTDLDFRVAIEEEHELSNDELLELFDLHSDLFDENGDTL